MVQRQTVNVDVLFRALADRNRLRILHLLRQGELCVCYIVDILGILQPAASRHLAYLKRAGFVRSRKRGLWRYYSLTPAQTGLHRQLLACIDSCSALVPELRSDLKRLARLLAAGACCAPPMEK
jgi:ArsR family transcriptional regulator